MRVPKNLMQNKITKIIPAFLWSGIIFFLCFLPGNKIPKEDWLDKIYFDKIVHAFLYFVFFFLIIRISKTSTKSILLRASTLCIAQGILIELVQGSSIIKNRSFDIYDIVANVLGVLIALIIVFFKTK